MSMFCEEKDFLWRGLPGKLFILFLYHCPPYCSLFLFSLHVSLPHISRSGLLSLLISVICFSPMCFQCRGTVVGWICVFLFGLLTKHVVSCAQLGREWIVISEREQSESRGSSCQYLRGCVNRILGKNVTHQLHTIIINQAKQTTIQEEEAWPRTDCVKHSRCLVNISTQEWTRMIRSQRLMCPLSGGSSILKGGRKKNSMDWILLTRRQ